MRSYHELLSDDPAWPALAAAATASQRVQLLPRDEHAARECLERLQVSTHSTLGALAHETGGLLVDHGWLRILGSGHPRMRRALGTWNEQLGIALADFMLVADDAVGGAYAINGGALGPERGTIYYFAPDRLAWENTALGFSAFVNWAFTGDLADYYANLRWPGWENEIERLSGDQAIHLAPPPWTREGKDVSRVSRRPVPALELWNVQQQYAQALGPPRDA